MENEIDYDKVTGLIKEHIKGLELTDTELQGLIEIEDQLPISTFEQLAEMIDECEDEWITEMAASCGDDVQVMMEAMDRIVDSKFKILILYSKIVSEVQDKILRELGYAFDLDDINDMVMSIVYEFRQFGGEYIDE
jgi:hypothetical protein